MTDIRFSQAAGAYNDALKAAENILQKVGAQSTGAGAATKVQDSGFLDMVGGALASARNAGYNSESMATKSLMGKADITDVVMAVSDAETALNTVVAIRDRVINAYQDILKMPI